MEAYKTGQGSLARLSAWLITILALALGMIEVYSWIHSRDDKPLIDSVLTRNLPFLGVPLSLKFVICVAIFIGLIWLVRRFMERPVTVDTLIETEMEMKKVSWPTMPEAMNATWIVVLVTLILTASLFFFDFLLGSFLRMIF